MLKIDVATLLKNESPNETLKRTYRVNRDEVYISLRKEMVQQDGYYLVEKAGKNIKLTPAQPYPVRSHPEDRWHRKIRCYAGRSPCIALPTDCARPGQLFRVIRSQTGIIWLLLIESFSYADETSVPPEILRAV